MKNYEIENIKVSSELLQEPINNFIDDIKSQFNIDLNNKNVSDEKMTEINEYSLEYFNEYEVYNDKLNKLAGELNTEGYNVLATAIEYDEESLLIVNETLRNYVLDQVSSHQEKMQKLFEKNNQELNFER
ncbi:MAG: hypothetical protein ACRC8P_02295 [Spiroplasma sp.]